MRASTRSLLVLGCAVILWLEVPGAWSTLNEDLLLYREGPASVEVVPPLGARPEVHEARLEVPDEFREVRKLQDRSTLDAGPLAWQAPLEWRLTPSVAGL